MQECNGKMEQRKRSNLIATTSPAAIEAAKEVTPGRISRLLQVKGPLAVRHITQSLNQDIPFFQNLSLSKQRRLIMSVMESGDKENLIVFEKIGWGLWTTKKVLDEASYETIRDSTNVANSKVKDNICNKKRNNCKKENIAVNEVKAKVEPLQQSILEMKIMEKEDVLKPPASIFLTKIKKPLYGRESNAQENCPTLFRRHSTSIIKAYRKRSFRQRSLSVSKESYERSTCVTPASRKSQILNTERAYIPSKFVATSGSDTDEEDWQSLGPSLITSSLHNTRTIDLSNPRKNEHKIPRSPPISNNNIHINSNDLMADENDAAILLMNLRS